MAASKRVRLDGPTILSRAKKYTLRRMDTGCLEWIGAIHGGGYGAFWDGVRTGPAHRIVYEAMHNVVLRRDQFVCHSCDNRRCVNLDHLWIGTAKENTQDMISKGRRVQSPICGETLSALGAEGEKNNMAKLSDAQVDVILTSDESAKAIAERFGVTRNHVYRIRNGGRWQHKDAR